MFLGALANTQQSTTCGRNEIYSSCDSPCTESCAMRHANKTCIDSLVSQRCVARCACVISLTSVKYVKTTDAPRASYVTKVLPTRAFVQSSAGHRRVHVA